MGSENNILDSNDVYGYHIFPPFIDAYMNSFWSTQITMSEIKNKMEGHAIEWGSEVVGKSVLHGREIPKHNDKIVLCCAYTYIGEEDISHKKYLIVLDEFSSNWYDKLEFIEADILSEWDVT